MLKALSAHARRATAGGAVVALLGSMLVWSAPSASAAACTTFGGFEIDGNTAPGTCGGTDWTSPGLGIATSTGYGMYQANPNDDSPTSTWNPGSGSAPGKIAFGTVQAFSQIVGGEYYAYIGWTRQANTGTGGFAIEIDNAGVQYAPDGTTPRPNRSNGGFVFYITIQGTQAPKLTSTCSFTSQATYPTSTGGPNCNAGTHYASAASSNGLFEEIGLNVTELADVPGPSCPAPSQQASLYLRGFTGSSSGPTGNLEDFSPPFGVVPNSTCVLPAMSTTATPGNSTIDGLSVTAPGSVQHDVATVGSQAVPGVGSVKFFLCPPAAVTANGGDCSAGGTQIGSAVALSGSGSASSANFTVSSPPAAADIGKYCWRSEFTPSSGDHHYLAAAHTNGDTECFTVVHAAPKITTQISTNTSAGAVANSVGFTTIGDTATLTPVVSGANLSTQHLTFELYGPFPTAPTASSCIPSMKVAGAGGDAGLTKVNDTTWQAIATGFTPTPTTGAGYYTWVTHYDGDAINDAVPAGGCGAATETAQLLGASVSVAKGTPNPTISAGDKVVYDLNVQNVGAGTASDVVITDILPVLPGGGTWQLAATPGYNCTIADVAGQQVVTCNVGNLNPVASTQVAEVSATTTPADCGTISNRATLSSDGGGQNTTPFVDVKVLCPHLSITKTADHGGTPVSVGTDIGFTVTVTNDGQGTASGVVLTDTLPTGPGIAWTVDADPAKTHGFASCVIAAGVLTCTGTLAQGASAAVHITSPTRWTGTGADEVNSCIGGTDGTGTYDNKAQVEASNVIGTPSDSAAETVACPNLTITKTADAAAVNAGTDIGFTVTATNNGGGTATGVTVTDNLPGGPDVHWVESPDVAACDITGPDGSQVLTCTVAALAPHTSIEVHVQSSTTFASCRTGAAGTTGTYANEAGVTASNDPQTPSDKATVLVECADLVINKTADHSTPVNVGSPIGFSITVTNNGTGSASGVLVTDDLPAGPGIVWTVDASVDTAPLTCGISGGVLTCTGSLGKGASAVVHVTSPTVWKRVGERIVNSCNGGSAENGTYDNTATVAWANGPKLPISSEQAVETVLCPDLAITKEADSSTVSAGEPIGYTITVHNFGAGDAVGTTITDTLPTGTGIDWTFTMTGPKSCDIAAGVLTCTGDLLADTVWTVHLSSGTEFASCGTYSNVATVGASNAPSIDSDPAATVTVNCPKVTLAKTADAGSVDAGSPIGFTVAVTNDGSGTAFAVVIEDVLPKGNGITWTLKPGAPEGCSIANVDGTQTLTCSGVDLRPGETESVGVVSQTAFASCAAYVNTATATVVNQVGGKLTDSASTSVLCSALVLGKTADAATVNAGDQIGYTVTLTNADTETTGTAKSVTISDPLPAGPAGSGVDWAISPAYAGPGACEITGAVGSQTLTCSVGDVGPGASISVHVVSSTAFAACAVYDNTATLSAANAPTATATATTAVQCPALTLTKKADAVQVPSGSGIGFTLTATNAGPGSAANAAITDPLPTGDAGSDVKWAISPAYTGPGVCAITGSAGSQLLACAFGPLAAGATATVHIVSTTTTGLVADCASYTNSASLTANNAPTLVAADTTTVVCPPLPTEVSRTPAAPAAASGSVLPLAITGSGPLDLALLWAVALVVLGAVLTVAGVTRRRRSH